MRAQRFISCLLILLGSCLSGCTYANTFKRPYAQVGAVSAMLLPDKPRAGDHGSSTEMTMDIQQAASAKAEMLIRKPVAEVFEAFVDPAVTTRFWFTKSSGRLEAGKQVQWDWEMYGASAQVDVKAIEENRRILIEWSGDGTPTTVEWIFTPRAGNTTFVSITNSGFSGDGDEAVKQAMNSTEGFTLVLAGLKALLEHNINLNLVPDRFPDAHVKN